jgi:type VI protein secretion system component VasF
MAQAVTRYVARRLVERERALADDAALGQASAQKLLKQERRRRRRTALRSLVLGVVLGMAALFLLAMFYGP